jgi:ATP-dependent exoDNAse (exonuclease V) alpha subunit
MSFKLIRLQYPVRLAFSMTMNKSQGQSRRYVGVDLREEVFSHGQLYVVALSRAISGDGVSVLLPETNVRPKTASWLG